MGREWLQYARRTRSKRTGTGHFYPNFVFFRGSGYNMLAERTAKELKLAIFILISFFPWEWLQYARRTRRKRAETGHFYPNFVFVFRFHGCEYFYLSLLLISH
jgi:hypothetical protein